MPSPTALLQRARDARPGLDHAVRAVQRYQADAGDRQAAAVTFFGFLSFFPLISLAAGILSYALGDEAVGTVVRQIDQNASGLATSLKLGELLSNDREAGIAGAIGLVGLLYSGLGWVDAMREAIRTIWHHNVKEGNFLVKKAKDVLVLAGLGLTVVLSVGVSAATGAFTGAALDLVGLEETFVATAVAKVVGIALGLLASTALFLYLFWRLPRVTTPLRRVLRGAVLAAVLFEVVKRVGAIYIERTTENPLYGTFAVIVGLLIWINIVSRLLLLCAAWTVTAPYDSDVAPSGTANAELAAEAGIPEEFADADPDNPPAIQQDGAPSPLAAAVQGVVPSQDVPEGRGDGAEPDRRRAAAPAASSAAGVVSWSSSTAQGTGPGPAAGTAVLDRDEPHWSAAPKSQRRAVQAGQFTAGALGVVLTAVVLHVGRTLRGLRHR